MRVAGIENGVKDETCRLSATVRLDGDPDPFALWFEAECAGGMPACPWPGDALLCGLLPVAMARGEPLELDAPLSPRLRGGLPEIQSILRAWFPGARRVAVRAPDGAASAPPAAGRGGAVFFSGGVDSFHALLKDDARPAAERRYARLVYVVDYDLHPGREELLAQVLDMVGAVAEATGRGVVRVATNLKPFARRHLAWDWAHGPVLASAAHVLSGAFATVGIPATLPYHLLHPFGSHALLDPLWSGSALDIVHDGAELSRADKIVEWIAHSPLALRHLRVCWENRDGRYNCGVCEKCVRTQLALLAADALDRCPTFDRPPTPWAVLRAVRRLDGGNYIHAADNVRLLRRRRDVRSRTLAAALSVRLAMVRAVLAWRVLRGRFGVCTRVPAYEDRS